MKWLKSVLHSGISEDDEYSKKRETLLSNYIAFILCIAILTLVVYRLALVREIEIINRLLLGLFLMGLPILINRLSFTVISRLYLCYFPVLFIWYSFLYALLNSDAYLVTTVYDSMRIYLLAVSFIPYLLFRIKNPIVFSLGIFPTLFSFIFFEMILSHFGLGYQEFGIVEKDYQLMQLRSLVAYLMINGGCFAFQSIIANSDKFNQKIQSELQEKNLKIEEQHRELQKSHQRLNEINQNLEKLVEEKTENIRVQNQKLLRYAHANSHHVRGPVARLLGLIQLLKLDAKANYPWFFKKVEEEANDIDQITRSISRDLDDVGIGEGELSEDVRQPHS